MATDFKLEIWSRIELLRQSAEYSNYARVRDAIYVMMDDWYRLDPAGGPSAYWQQEIEGFLYMFDASPAMIGKLRDQCYHITAVKSYDYREHHNHRAGDYQAKFDALRAVDADGLFVPEPTALGGFGFDVGPGLANLDTLKFYEVLIGMSKAGLLKRFRDPETPRVALEIGSGWGGFAYQFKKVCPQSTYVCVDLPPTMLFSAVYLLSLFPDAKALIYGEPGFEREIENIRKYDFVFVPHFYFPMLPKPKLDLALNMVSFQEMTTQQVDGYARSLKEYGCRRIYSLNKDRSRHNTELSTVSEILEQYYNLNLIEVSDMQYTQLRPTGKPKGDLHVLDYRHYFGYC